MLKRQENNLRKLALYLLALPKDYKQFDMEDYYLERRLSVWVLLNQPPCEVKKKKHHACGAVACALGHGPLAGISAKGFKSWNDYSLEKFSLDYYSDEWEWCFSGQWTKIDNTAQGAGKRILWLLENGCPSNILGQRNGIEKLCYTDWEPLITQ